MGIGVLLVEADGGESGRKALLAGSGVLIGPTPENDPARHPRQPNVRFRELGVERGRRPKEVTCLKVRLALYLVELPNASTNEIPRRLAFHVTGGVR
jgi:hypothetical protein